MNCQSCGGPLPQDAQACPNCGTLTPAYYSTAGDSQAQTLSSAGARGMSTAPSGTPYDTPYTEAAMPRTDYGSNPYNQTANPYGTTAPPPPPNSKKPLGLLVSAVVLVLVLLGAGFIVLPS